MTPGTTAPAALGGFEQIASEIAADIASAKANAASWMTQVENKAIAGLSMLQRLQQNKIVQVLESAAFSPQIEADIARWLADAAQVFATAAPGTPLPVPPSVPPAPAPADPAPAPAPAGPPPAAAAAFDAFPAPADNPGWRDTGAGPARQ